MTTAKNSEHKIFVEFLDLFPATARFYKEMSIALASFLPTRLQLLPK